MAISIAFFNSLYVMVSTGKHFAFWLTPRRLPCRFSLVLFLDVATKQHELDALMDAEQNKTGVSSETADRGMNGMQ